MRRESWDLTGTIGEAAHGQRGRVDLEVAQVPSFFAEGWGWGYGSVLGVKYAVHLSSEPQPIRGHIRVRGLLFPGGAERHLRAAHEVVDESATHLQLRGYDVHVSRD